MSYSINVAKNNRHYFATTERSISNENKLLEIYADLEKRFPASEGYSLSVSYDPQATYGVSVDTKKGSVTNSYNDWVK